MIDEWEKSAWARGRSRLIAIAGWIWSGNRGTRRRVDAKDVTHYSISGSESGDDPPMTRVSNSGSSMIQSCSQHKTGKESRDRIYQVHSPATLCFPSLLPPPSRWAVTFETTTSGVRIGYTNHNESFFRSLAISSPSMLIASWSPPCSGYFLICSIAHLVWAFRIGGCFPCPSICGKPAKRYSHSNHSIVLPSSQSI